VTRWWIVAAAATGLLAPGWIRAQVFIHGVMPGQPWRTACPHCDHVLVPAWYARAWLPRSHCPQCNRRIGPRTGTLEAVTVGTTSVLATTTDDPLVLAAVLVFAVAGTTLGFIDLAVHRLPNRLTQPTFAIAFTLLAMDAVWMHRPNAFLAALAGAATGAGVYLLLAFLGGGVGDIQLSLSTGLILGWHSWATALAGTVAGLALTSVCALGMVLAGRRKRGDHIAHGPGIIAATLVLTVVAGCRVS